MVSLSNQRGNLDGGTDFHTSAQPQLLRRSRLPDPRMQVRGRRLTKWVDKHEDERTGVAMKYWHVFALFAAITDDLRCG